MKKEPTINGPTIIELQYLDWSQCGGRHIVGEVVFHNPYRKVEIERRLTLREAKELGQTQEILWQHRHTRATNKFDTLEQLEKAAIKWCEQNLPNNDWLIQLNNSRGPHRPVGAKGKFKRVFKKLETLAKRWDKVRDNQSTAEMLEYYDEWKELVNV